MSDTTISITRADAYVFQYEKRRDNWLRRLPHSREAFNLLSLVGNEWGTNNLQQLLWLGTSSAHINQRIAEWVIQNIVLRLTPKADNRTKGYDYWTYHWPKAGWTGKLKHVPTLFDDNKAYLVTNPVPSLSMVSSVTTIGIADVGFNAPIVVTPPKEKQCATT